MNGNGPWNTLEDLQNAMGSSTVTSIFDDNNTGNVNSGAVDRVLARANAQVVSFLDENFYDLSAIDPANPPETLKAVELEFAIVYARDRKPEYWRQGQENERQQRLKAAFDMMERFKASKQRVVELSQKPKNVGGVVIDDGPRTIVTSADGTNNGGDF